MIALTSPVETCAHGWPAGVKLAMLCAATVVLFTVDSLAWHLVFFVAVLLCYALPGRVFQRTGLGRLWPLWPFVLVILLWHVLTDDWGDGLVIVLRMVTAVGLANLVTITTRLSDMMAVVLRLLRPFERLGLRTGPIALSMALVIRFTPTLIDKGQVLSLAWRARARRRAGWRIITPLAVLAIDDAEHVAEALRARGGL